MKNDGREDIIKTKLTNLYKLQQSLRTIQKNPNNYIEQLEDRDSLSPIKRAIQYSIAMTTFYNNLPSITLRPGEEFVRLRADQHVHYYTPDQTEHYEDFYQHKNELLRDLIMGNVSKLKTFLYYFRIGLVKS
jgi:hypothetical protein